MNYITKAKIPSEILDGIFNNDNTLISENEQSVWKHMKYISYMLRMTNDFVCVP